MALLHSSNADLQLEQDPLLKMLYFFPFGWFWLLFQKSSDCKCVDLFLGVLFNSIDHPVCFYVNTISFLLPLRCSTA